MCNAEPESGGVCPPLACGVLIYNYLGPGEEKRYITTWGMAFLLNTFGRVVHLDSIKTRVESAYGFSA